MKAGPRLAPKDGANCGTFWAFFLFLPSACAGRRAGSSTVAVVYPGSGHSTVLEGRRPWQELLFGLVMTPAGTGSFDCADSSPAKNPLRSG
jgi:hypothetical protein